MSLRPLRVFLEPGFLPAEQRRQRIELSFDGPVGADDGVGPLDQPHAHDALQQVVAQGTVGQREALVDQILAPGGFPHRRR
ncbi:hypothetical protein D9M68_803560 [compost metagenome]